MSKRRVKKLGITALAAVLMVSMAGMTGCKKEETKEYKDTDTVMSVKDDNGDKYKIDYATACTYVRIMQAEAYSYMQSMAQQSGGNAPDDIWAEEMTDSEDSKYNTYGEQFKGESLDTLETMLLSEVYSDKYNVDFTDEDQTKCEEVARDFIENNDVDSVEAMHADEESVENVLRLWTIEDRVRTAIIKDVDTDVSDDEAGQTTFNYATIYKDDNDDPEKTASDLIDAVKESGDFDTAASDAGLTAQSVSFTTSDPEYDDYDKTMLEKAAVLKDGECDSYVNDDGNTIVLYMKATKDESATETKKDTIISQRRTDLYEETVDGWKDEFKVNVNKKAWDSIKTDKNEVFTEKNDDSSSTTVNSGDNSTTVNVSSSDGSSDGVEVTTGGSSDADANTDETEETSSDAEDKESTDDSEKNDADTDKVDSETNKTDDNTEK